MIVEQAEFHTKKQIETLFKQIEESRKLYDHDQPFINDVFFELTSKQQEKVLLFYLYTLHKLKSIKLG